MSSLKNTVYSMTPFALEDGVAISFSCSTDLPDKCYFDVVRLQQVLSNLISNSVKYSPNGGKVTVTINTIVDGELIDMKDVYWQELKEANGSERESTELLKSFSAATDFYSSSTISLVRHHISAADILSVENLGYMFVTDERDEAEVLHCTIIISIEDNGACVRGGGQ